ncbi:MAG: class I SAM-dependent methyltransferase [Acidimicrobiaceae bacterium]|nr:class I SAM-dependent methyltransferase [Acidimicrobiaceae bacterium]MDE0606522.1 class I SAM-dependent methyltransferase [Acidimicrobiaceae bacterium]
MPDAKSTGLELLDAAGVTVGGDAPQDIHIHDDRLWSRILRDRELGLGESYMDGWWEANQLDEFLTVVQTADLRSMVTPSPQLLVLGVKAAIMNQQSKAKARRNAQAHYNIGNDLYERMLDKRMIYSCAYWRGIAEDAGLGSGGGSDDPAGSGDTALDLAQEAKLDLICRKLGLEPGMTLLDIGCGWGGFAQFAAERYQVEVTGISPAEEQIALARQRCSGLPVRIVRADYRDLDGTFDRITSIGMMEHVGPRNLSTFFDKCRELLDPDGMMLHHTIGSNDWRTSGDLWFDRYIFPGGVLPSLGQIAKAAQSRWTIEDVHNFGPYYTRTLLAWDANISSNWHEIPHYDERFRRMWHYYLMSSAAGFRARAIQLWQIVFTRSKRALPIWAPVR